MPRPSTRPARWTGWRALPVSMAPTSTACRATAARCTLQRMDWQTPTQFPVRRRGTQTAAGRRDAAVEAAAGVSARRRPCRRRAGRRQHATAAWPDIDWQPRLARPATRDRHRPIAQACARGLPLWQALNQAGRAPVQFVPQSELPAGTAYEALHRTDRPLPDPRGPARLLQRPVLDALSRHQAAAEPVAVGPDRGATACARCAARCAMH